MRRPLKLATCTLLIPVLALAGGASAQADLFGPISLVSEGKIAGGLPQQAEYAHDAAISGNGRYLAFDGSFSGRTGVWRRDLSTGAIEPVAGGNAELPSISESGRYISFTSTEDLVPSDEAHGPNVWVRDMQPGPGEPEYTLVSAANGSSKGLTYSYPSEPVQEEQEYGSLAAGRSAIDAQGDEVVFVTTAVSDLVPTEKDRQAEAKGEAPPPETPAMQVAVRYLRRNETRLVSGEYDEGLTTGAPVSDGEAGAVYPGATPRPAFTPVPADGAWGIHTLPGASISADGSTVAWMGDDISKQARMLPAESTPPLYTEPLWRRIQPGSETPTERVTGGSDPTNPACLATGEQKLPAFEEQSASDPCLGPFKASTKEGGAGSRGIWSEAGSIGEGDFVPRLSRDGYSVAFLGSAVPTVLGNGFGLEPEGESADLYLVSMQPGLTRDEALKPLTEVGGENVAASSSITDFDISPDGTQVAFTTRRTQFVLGSPAYVSPPMAEPGESELFDVDLADDTLTRVTRGYNGQPSEQTHESILSCSTDEDPYCNPITIGAQSPSFSSDGALIGFSSTASNLVFGDGNSSRKPTGAPEGEVDGSDAFLVERQPTLSLPTPQSISADPITAPIPQWRLGLTALSEPNGNVLLYVVAPGQGTLSSGAHATVLVKASSAKAKRRGRASRSEHPRQRTVTRTVATATKPIDAGGEVVELTLKLAKPYAQLASQHGGLSATIDVTFKSASHTTLHQWIQVTFARAAHHKHARRSILKGRAAR